MLITLTLAKMRIAFVHPVSSLSTSYLLPLATPRALCQLKDPEKPEHVPATDDAMCADMLRDV